MKRFVFFAIAAVMTVSMFICLTSFSAKAQTPEKSNIVAIYDDIKIGQGDTLEGIAIKYNTAGVYTNAEYIKEIKRINNIHSDNIHAGCYLTIITAFN